MRPVRITLTGPGFTDPIILNYMQPTFNVGLAAIPAAAAATVSYKAQFTMDAQDIWRDVNWTQAGTTVTFTDGKQPYGAGAASKPTSQNPHGLVTGDTVTVKESAGPGAVSIDGNYAATVVSPTVYTVTVTPNQTVASGTAKVVPQRWTDSTVMPAASATRLQVNSTQPATAVRFVVATLTVDSIDFLIIQGADS